MARIEHDLLGDIQVPDGSYYGAHTQRAVLNFPSTGRDQAPSLVRALAVVKKAAAAANLEIGAVEEGVATALLQACDELAAGQWREQILVDPLAGGAGTSLNMNVNEVLANRANEILGGALGAYAPVHPLDTVNLHQSTNDAYATAVRVAALWELGKLEASLVTLQAALQHLEGEFADVVMVGRTQLQDAVPMTAGQLFGTYAEATARDRWRVFKSTERLKVVNLGGTAVGTGIGAPKKYIFQVIENLRRETSLPLSRAENPVEATANQDALVEVDGILTAMAANILKMSTDLRILSVPAVGEVRLPPRQAGSSIMPGKVNPVIAEYASQMALATLAGHAALSTAVASGNLQLSQFLPLAAWYLLDNLRLLRNAAEVLASKCFTGLEVDAGRAAAHLEKSLSVAAALVPVIGYEKAEAAVAKAQAEDISLREALTALGVTPSTIDEALSPSRLRRLGH
ncbi:MAG: aspartate ammonia-lyase [Candidatus Lernaella stagnicola]|nr:aspartate ammonia-lyase [Candidatus Lernaella stagnicola]